MADGFDVTLLGERLRRVRQKRRETLEDVKEATGISIATLSRIERGGTKDVRSETLLTLVKWMGMTIRELEEPVTTTRGGKAVQDVPDMVELHLRADRKLDPQTAVVLMKMFRAAYETAVQQKTAQERKG